MSDVTLGIIMMLGSIVTTLLYGSLAVSASFSFMRGRNFLAQNTLLQVGVTACLSFYYVILELDWMITQHAMAIGCVTDILWLLFEVGAYFLIRGSIKRIDACLGRRGSCYKIKSF